MLDTDFKEYLDDEFGRIFPENQNKYRELFKRLGFGMINHDFVEFWSTYSDEIYGKIGYLAPTIQKFIENKQFSKHWDNFEYFIKDYLNYNA